ncbi:MAG: right-handed parallel beta-helix repeat-containing protein [Phycisphaerales bacterium]|nr:right-handed parallel beta-helix repeat-containing protein [Phycisphaerales bacterium]
MPSPSSTSIPSSLPALSSHARGPLLIAALMLAGAAPALAGPLDPPGGAVAPTYKTLGQIEPRTIISPSTTPGDGDSVCKITQPGSYYLTGDLTGESGKHGIEIEASHVTIDFNGFQLKGVPGSLAGIDGNGTGPGSPTSAAYITLKHGVITGWGANGVTANNAGAWIIEEMKFAGNTGTGISVNSGTVFTRCYFYQNSLDGCQTSNHVEFYYCFASQNSGHGYSAGSNSTFQNCEAGSNGGSGFVVPLGGRVINSTASGNAAVGVIVGDGGSVDNCKVDVNLQGGILVGKGGNVSRCAVDGNGTATTHHGIQARLYGAATVTTATIADCIVTGNAGSGIASQGGTIRGCMAEGNGNFGISMGDRGVISQCTAKGNTAAGIFGGQSVAILDCSSGANGTHGIQVNDDCLVRGNTCDSNGTDVANGAGIYIADQFFPLVNSDNRIEENNVSDNDIGIWVADTGNIVIRNSATSNATNYTIVAGNTKGTIIAAAGADITTGNSFANFEY